MIKPRVKGKEQDGKRPHLTKDTAQQAGDDRRLREGRVWGGNLPVESRPSEEAGQAARLADPA